MLPEKFIRFDTNISKNLKRVNIITRPDAGNGIYVIILLPLLMLIYFIRHVHIHPEYNNAVVFSLGLLTCSVLLVTLLSHSADIMRQETAAYTKLMMTSLISILVTLPVHYAWGIASFQNLLVCLICTFIFSHRVCSVLVHLPKCFTLGEAILVQQGMALMMYCTIKHTLASLATFSVPHSEEELVTLIIMAGLFGIQWILNIFLLLPQSCLKYAVLFSIVLMIIPLIFLDFLIAQSSVLWVITFILHTQRLLLIISWGVCVLAAVLLVNRHTAAGVKANTRTRKVFHVLAVAVYLPGILIDVELMILASGVALAALILIEFLRLSKIIKSLSDIFNQAFLIYCDEKDVGGIALTPIYLLVGISCPLALVPQSKDPARQLDLLSGVLSIGIGDAAASWFGSKYGRNKWNGSQKTVEGTIFNIAFQVTTIYVLHSFGYLMGHRVLLRGSLAAIASGTVEAFTDQVDNLVLPIITLLTLSVC